MSYQINTLESCWYISPPWGKNILPLVISLLERVYLPKTKAFGYCCGVEWSSDGWCYSIALDSQIILVSGVEIVASGQLQAVRLPKPTFMVGELVKFRLAADAVKVRTVLGLQLINDSWFYSIELRSPFLPKFDEQPLCILPQSFQQPTVQSRLAWVTDYDLTGV
ncbi:DUF1392 family protein [Nostoc sp. UHCC 0870]|uniref:DUF1392 family protein n=1 Tax=Nostoc sp. UHCC 0870 TaxID=2914041 RepID=UPI001EDEF63C|nr:DUF1392 family protein [Nostoc sp. UHCC 0870]UKP01108.1 DUF1392 domain-containing protein [Nostoc sp. UHCC 0870]UKP01283.1 DUF1392 domain-containing protein [Nostoc sp. UHCC 0870]